MSIFGRYREARLRSSRKHIRIELDCMMPDGMPDIDTVLIAEDLRKDIEELLTGEYLLDIADIRGTVTIE